MVDRVGCGRWPAPVRGKETPWANYRGLQCVQARYPKIAGVGGSSGGCVSAKGLLWK